MHLLNIANRAMQKKHTRSIKFKKNLNEIVCRAKT